MRRVASLGFVCAVLAAACYRKEREPVPQPPVCVDGDGDGYGEGVDCRGPDCDAADPDRHACDCPDDAAAYGCPCPAFDVTACFDGPVESAGVGECQGGLRRCRDEGVWGACEDQILPAEEICNGLDDDCDGEIDEAIVHECSDCTSGCTLVGFGAGRAPFLADGPGLAVTADGALTLTGESVAPRLAWIPSTLEGTLSKIDTAQRAELGRYRTGPRGAASLFNGAEGDVPAAVAATPTGDGIVANRAPGAVPTLTRIRAGECPAGGDGVLTTSAGHDVLPWGEDDCVAWHVEVGAPSSIGRALVLELRPELDGAIHEYVWIATAQRLLEVDAEVGEQTGTVVELDQRPTSAAIDAEGILWLAHTGTHELLRVDPLALDSEVVPLPEGESAHDVAVDPRGDVWTAGSRVLRYRPGRDVWEVAEDSRASSGAIAVDTRGVAWTLDDGGDVQRVEDAGGQLGTRTLPTGAGGTGIAVDHDGLVWAIGTREAGLVTVLDPDNPELGAETCCDFVRSSYARGDLTGAPRFADLGPATWTGRVESAESPCPIFWRQLDVRGTIEAGVRIVAAVRAAGTPEELEAEPWLPVAEAPPDAWPVDVGPALDQAEQQGRLLEVRLAIDPLIGDELPVIDAVTIERIEFCL